MGERHSGDGLLRRRYPHPGGTVSAPDRADGARADAAFEARLGAALRAGGVDAEAERRAVAAFRAARESAPARARTRRRDDWRPAARRRARLSLKATLSMALASLTLGGVAVAAIGSAGSGADGHRDTPPRAHSSTTAPHRPAAPAGATGRGSLAASARPDHPATARDTVAHCRTYVRAGGRGGALDSAAWQRLVTAAGGKDEVAAYCAARLTSAQAKQRDKSGYPPVKGQSAAKGKNANGGGDAGRQGPGRKK
ncbi:hypothetical protein [Streptomyces sp. NPDC046759]|uniref:hypothetical protein n=1 Tax=Streptomyces sp. NPDC046759 TaxID=3155019 RepID=UPI00340EEC1A